MKTKELDIRELRKLKVELENSLRARKRNIVTGLILLLIFVGLYFGLYNVKGFENISDILILLASLAIVWILGWLNFKKSILNLKTDIEKGIKIIDSSKIVKFKRIKHKLVLENGFEIDSSDILRTKWKIGDFIEYEYMPIDKFILQLRITHYNTK